MATRADFDEHEWEAIQKGLTGAGMLVSLADRDFTDSFGEELESQTIEALRSATQSIGAKAPDEVEAYRDLVLGGAQHVADAKGGGTSDAERAAIEKISAALGGA
jgi:hypothetical protein